MPHAAWIPPAVAAYRAGRPLALLFDYDGTLTPIVGHPDLAHLSAEVRERLADLLRLPRVAVAVLSGRALDEVRTRVALSEVWYAGSGGLEMAFGGGRWSDPRVESFEQVLTATHHGLVGVLRRYPGTWVERKPGAMAVHYRGLLPLAGVCFRRDAAEVLARVAEVRFRAVAEAIEVTPAGGWDKGTAVEVVLARLRSEHPLPPYPVYFGDSANDQEGMAATAAAGGVTVGVGAEAPSAAAYCAPDPASIATALTELARRLTAGGDRSVPPPPGEVSPHRTEFGAPNSQVVEADPDHRDRHSRAV